MRVTIALLVSLLTGLGTACYSMNIQDRGQLVLNGEEQTSAYCHLVRYAATTDGGDDDAGDVAAARALLRGAHASTLGILRRNTVDAGPIDAGILCP